MINNLVWKKLYVHGRFASLLYTGDCIGLLFSPLQRFPVIPTFGLLELTGWTSCPSTQCPLNTHQQHPTGRYSVDGEKFKAVPKSILKFSKTQETPPNSNDDLVMEFNPTLTAESRIDYIVTLSGVKVLVSECMTFIDFKSSQYNTSTCSRKGHLSFL